MYVLDDPDEFNRRVPLALRRIGVEIPAGAGLSPTERAAELLDLLDAWVLCQRLWKTPECVTATLPTIHTQLRHELRRLRPDVEDADLRSAADRAHQALALRKDSGDEVLELLALAICRIFTARLLTPQEAVQPEVVGYGGDGPIYASARTQLLDYALELVQKASQRLAEQVAS